MFVFVCHIIRHVVEILCTLCWIFFKCGIALFIGRGEYCFPHMLSLFVPQAWFSCVLITKDAICNAYWGDKGKRGTTKIKVQASLPFQNKVPLLILTSLKEGIGLQHGDAEFWPFVTENLREEMVTGEGHLAICIYTSVPSLILQGTALHIHTTLCIVVQWLELPRSPLLCCCALHWHLGLMRRGRRLGSTSSRTRREISPSRSPTGEPPLCLCLFLMPKVWP